MLVSDRSLATIHGANLVHTEFPVILKQYQLHATHREIVLRGVREEECILAALSLPGQVVGHYCTFVDPQGHVTHAMEAIGGADLSKILNGVQNGDDDLKEILSKIWPDLIFQVATTIRKLHLVGIVHRDLKPESIMVKLSEMEQIVKVTLLGFDLAVLLDDQHALSGVAGTDEYMAPEVWEGPYRHEVDWYSLGVILEEILQMCKIPHLDLGIVKGLTAKFPEERWGYDELENVLRPASYSESQEFR